MVDGFIDNIVKQQMQNLDNTIIKFLRENGYEVPKVITNDYLDNLRNKLAKEDKFVDIIQWTDYDFKNSRAIQHIIPFMNCISNPLSEEIKNELIERYKNAENK